MKKRVLSILASVCLLFALSPATGLWTMAEEEFPPYYEFRDGGVFDNDAANEMLELINSARKELGYPLLEMDFSLMLMARERAAERSYYYADTDLVLRPWLEKMSLLHQEAGCGESHGVSFEPLSAEQATQYFLQEEGTASLLLHPEAVSIGLACYENCGIYYWVQTVSRLPVMNMDTFPSGKQPASILMMADLSVMDMDVITTSPAILVGDSVEVFCYNRNQELFGAPSVLLPSGLTVDDESLVNVEFIENRYVLTGLAPGEIQICVTVDAVFSQYEDLRLYTTLTVIEPKPSTGVLGDVDSDGDITSTDARLVLQYFSRKISDIFLDLSVADVDGDKQITSTDARLILQYSVKKIDTFPVT